MLSPENERSAHVNDGHEALGLEPLFDMPRGREFLWERAGHGETSEQGLSPIEPGHDLMASGRRKSCARSKIPSYHRPDTIIRFAPFQPSIPVED